MAFKNRKKELDIAIFNQELEEESKIDGWAQELIQKNEENLAKGIIPYSCSFPKKKVIQIAANYHREKGWACRMRPYHVIGFMSEYHLTIDFPGPLTRFWRSLKKIFLSLFSKSNKMLSSKSIYRD